MPYIQRNVDSSVKGVFSNEQEGYAEEFIADDDPDLLAYLNPPTDSVKAIQGEIQKAMDVKAQDIGYDDIRSACAYASSDPWVPDTDPNFETCEKFRREGNYAQNRMSLTWAMCYAYLATVQAGANPMPTPSEAVAMMPEFSWPD